MYLVCRITTYLFTAAFLGGLGYVAYKQFAPKPKKSRRAAPTAKDNVSSSAGTATASGVSGYEEEWIPAHHLKMRGTKKSGAASSGDELSGGETSGTEGKRRKGRK